MGFGANGGFDFTKELKEMLRNKAVYTAASVACGWAGAV